MNRSRNAAAEQLARFYDLDLQDDDQDIEMYVALAIASNGRVLELACGTGRICIPLAAAGHDVVGVDNDPDMLARAQRNWDARHETGDGGSAGIAGSADDAVDAGDAGSAGSLRLVGADMLDLALDERFGLVVLALNTLLLLPDRAAQQRVLETIAEHLSADGRAVIDVWLPTPDDLVLYDGRIVLDWVRRDDESDKWVAKMTAATYAPASNMAVITSFFDAWRDGGTPHRTHRTDEVRFIGWSELQAMLDRAGLEVQICAGDYALNVLEEHGDRVVVICTAKRRSPGDPSVGRSDQRRLL